MVSLHQAAGRGSARTRPAAEGVAAMTRSIEDFAQECDMPTWKAAEAMVRLLRRGLVSAPDNIAPDEHIEWLERTYPKPQHLRR